MHYLYKTINMINEKFYVGMHSTDDLNDGYLGSGKYLRRSINKYGKENFKIEFLEFFNNRNDLIERERDFVSTNFIKDSLCMNLRTGGTCAPISNLGSKRSEETKLKMSKWIRTKEYRDKISLALQAYYAKGGKSWWLKKSHIDIEKAKNKLSVVNKGKCISKITRDKISAGKKKAMTQEIKDKISAGLMGRHHTEESKIKMRKPKSRTKNE